MPGHPIRDTVDRRIDPADWHRHHDGTSGFPMPGEWHSVADPVMPVWHDVHRTCDTAFLADEAPGLGKRVQSYIDHPSIAPTRTLDAAADVTVAIHSAGPPSG